MKTEVTKTIDAITEYLNDLSRAKLVAIHNEYCQETSNGDDEIFSNDEDFFNTFFDGKVIEAIRAVTYGEYKYNDDYVKFNGYGNLESFNDPSDYVSISEIAQAIYDEDFTPYDIELTEPEEEETED